MNDEIAIDYKLTLPPPTEGQAKEADKLAVGVFMLAEKWNASPQVMLYALHRVISRMEQLAKKT